VKLFLPFVLIVLLGTPAIAANITQIVSAGIYDCDDPSRDAIAKRYLAYVEACVAPRSCTRQPSGAIPEQETARAYDMGFSLKVKCGNARVSS